MNEEKRNALGCLLTELSIDEVHNELNRYMDKHDKENALRVSKVEEAITIILEYLER